ncbi:B-cell receptor-associated protein 31-like-domain-containing protein [Dipodascopsis tothii]|uniref:B-cell receptor-associated protein 31-like-domain-containing protein n=1 Tax=Dipodascopsis tothii TaxID=44089 RepID=UPI0034CF2A9E
MTLYYTLVFIILVAEMGLFFFLVAPLPIAIRRRVFTFISTSELVAKSQYTLKITFVFIFILFVDSVNRVYRVQGDMMQTAEGTKMLSTASDRSEVQARKFYAQRNMYLCGFTLFLSLILNRTYALVVDLIIATDKLTKRGETVSAATSDEQVKTIEALQKEIKAKDADLKTLKKQCEGLTAEYERVSDELNAKSATGEAAKTK